MSKVIIAGSRTLEPDVEMIESFVNILREQYGIEPTEIVSGACRGVDMAGEEWAKANNIPIKRFPPDWKTHGRAAGPIRNRQMAEYADALIAFVGGASRGTRNMIGQAGGYGLMVVEIHFGVDGDEVSP